MIFLLIFYLVFLLLYIVFNIYSILKVRSLRLRNDQTQPFLTVYIVIISFIIFVSLIVISSLDWSTVQSLSL